MSYWILKQNIIIADAVSDFAVLLVAIILCIFLVKIFFAYGKPRIMIVLIIGIDLYLVAAFFSFIEDIYLIPYILRYIVFNLALSTGAALTALGLLLALRRLLELAKIDPLTGIYNRRHFKEILDIEMARSKRNGLVFSILFIDLNDFKHVNDNLGHCLGDVVLRNVTQELKSIVRASDVVARWGGDEFILLFPQTDRVQAAELSERLVGKISKLIINDINLSISIGIATYPDDEESSEALLNAADMQMYQNKRQKKKAVHDER